MGKKTCHCLGVIMPSPHLLVSPVLSPLSTAATFNDFTPFLLQVPESASKKWRKSPLDAHDDWKSPGKVLGFLKVLGGQLPARHRPPRGNWDEARGRAASEKQLVSQTRPGTCYLHTKERKCLFTWAAHEYLRRAVTAVTLTSPTWLFHFVQAPFGFGPDHLQGIRKSCSD